MSGVALDVVLGLLGAVVAGAFASARGWLGDRDRAIEVLNALGIRVAFPALVVASILEAPSIAGLGWLVGPAAVALALLVVAIARLVLTPVRQDAGSIALAVAFGNVAYLGVPLGTALLGEEHAALAAVAATAHVAIAVTAGPILLVRWSGGAPSGSWRRALAQPLFVSLVLGLFLRFVPLAWQPVGSILGPIGSTAAPIGAFVLGVYLERHRGALEWPDGRTLLVAAARLLLVPAIALALGTLLVTRGLATALDVRLGVLLAAMPCAISTFAIAHDEGHGSDLAARSIVVTTVLSLLTIPGWLALSP